MMKRFHCATWRLIVLAVLVTLDCSCQALEECVTQAGGTTSCSTTTTTTTTTNNGEDNATQTATRQNKDKDQLYKPPTFCQDMLDDCEARLNDNQDDNDNPCMNRFQFMSQQCAKTCRICSTRDPNSKTIVSHNKVTVDRIFAGVPQVLEGQASIDTWLQLRETEDYMYNQVYVNDTVYQDVRSECQLRHELCTYWAAIGECKTNPNYMKTACAPACRSCLDVKFEHRCPLDQTGPTALSQPGELHAMFERILTDPQFAQYEPQALSRPTNGTADDAPWFLVLENVLTADECQALIDAGAVRGYKPSSEVGSTTRYDGRRESTQSDRRTSSTTWCKKECAQHPTAVLVLDRIQALTGIPPQNYEYLQLLKYKVGEKYTQHHDYIPHHLERNPGVRILTVYIYLNDVAAGGGTHFPYLNLTVTPKQGRVVIWPSVLDRNTSQIDPRTEHEALPVEQGMKYGANAWIHQRDFKTAHAKACAS